MFHCLLVSEHRREKHLQHGRATIFDDYAFLPKSIGLNFSGATYAVEVKPKQAWLPHIQQDFKNAYIAQTSI